MPANNGNPSHSSSHDLIIRLGRRITIQAIALLLATAVVVLIVVRGRTAFGLIAVAAFLAVALNHAVDWLQRRRFKRPVAIAIVLTLTAGIAVGLLVLFVPAAVQQAGQLVKRLPEVLASAGGNPTLRTLDQQFGVFERIKQAVGSLAGGLEQTAAPALRAIAGLFSMMAAFLTVTFLTVFMLIFGGGLVHALLREALPARRVRYRRVLAKIYRSVGGYLSGIAFVCLVNATLTTTLLAILRIPSFLPLGMLSGFSSLVPYAGPVVMGTSITLFSLATGGLWKGVVVAVFYIVYGQIEGNVLAPLVFRRTVQVNPLVSIMSLVVLGEVAGIGGAVIAVPLAAVGHVVLRELLILRRERLNLPLTGEAGSVRELPQQELKKFVVEDAAHRQAEQS